MPYSASRDPFRNQNSDALSLFPRQLVSITPNDGADLPTYIRGIRATTSGNVSVVPMQQDDETAVIIFVNAGSWVGGFFRKVNATNTTATGLVGALL